MKIVEGKWYRVVFEGVGTDGGCVRVSGGPSLRAFLRHATEVEELPDPVVHFVPGDRVRGKGTNYEYTVLHGGYVDHTHNVFIAGHTDEFTSEDYEKVI